MNIYCILSYIVLTLTRRVGCNPLGDSKYTPFHGPLAQLAMLHLLFQGIFGKKMIHQHVSIVTVSVLAC